MDEAVVLDDGERRYDDDMLSSVRVLSVPESDTYPEGIKYWFHYGRAGADEPVIRFDDHHGSHELHLGSATFEIDDYPGLRRLYHVWRAALPPDKRADW